jgi:uncharacterized protein (DUF2126 family)/transglutaminase-like putative cysteine protease
MGIKIALHHRTQYLYDKAVSLGPQVVQLRPTPHCRTPILSYSLEIIPAECILNWQLDPHANYLARLLILNKTTEFAVNVNLVADLTPVNPFAFFLEPGFETFPLQYTPELSKDLEPYRSTSPAGPLLRGFLRGVSREPQGTVSFLVALNKRVRDEIGYEMRLEHGVQSSEETLSLRTGSCRDSAWLLVEICRHLGFAARFVSGYLIQLAADEPADEPAIEGNDGGAADTTADTAALHAWAEVYLPGAGWIGMDPTSGLFTAEGHIPLVCTPSAAQAAPIGGTVEQANVDFRFEMSVRRLDEMPRLSRPYSEEQWARVRQVAHGIDEDLRAQDVRLTMGGEPTFVGIDEPESQQWNLEALGPLKRTAGLALIRRLRERTAPGGLLHFGQGKWYPGEVLPRWAFHCISRVDGVPVWENADLFASETSPQACTATEASEFIQTLTLRLNVTAENILPAFDPDDPEGEATQAAGYVLPLRRRQAEKTLIWSSQLWFDRPDPLVLSPGDSPIGYRIPVAMMPWVAPDELAYEEDENGIRLPPRPARHPELFEKEATPDPLPALPSTAETATELIRPSLCVQVREGRLHVFLPYVPVIADYLDLVAAIEETCQHLQQSVWLEGYTPPADARLRAFSLTPDPGVLEVNLPPCSDWDQLETISEILFEEAHRNRLIAAKFAYDGTQLATGGGSHIVIGGATREDSPLLRRPDLLRSMVGFWQNHPSLSYLFSGMYVGPTSQYPRVDEARVDALYELDLSFSQLPSPSEPPCPPWILDGLFRNLLVDVTGNTHRAEFCIDKMFPPEGAGLRLGLLELRAFEMAPHVRMGLMQMLLVRALVCLLWKQPFDGSLIRWGTALHDRFMLPHFVQRDLFEVLEALRRAGYNFEDAWFSSHFEFRFPRIGSIAADGVELELRQALEPWNVLAEETTSGGTGRSVDSSLERMQVKLTGLTTESRYVVACNGRRVPMHPIVATGNMTSGEAIAGIRYRARKLSSSLHPTIPVHTPLTFDLIDTWKGHSVGRCAYYAGPPDGSIYTGRPVDAPEAYERRLARFVVSAPPASIPVPEAEINSIFPMTLDLRWPAPGNHANLETISDAPEGTAR